MILEPKMRVMVWKEKKEETLCDIGMNIWTGKLKIFSPQPPPSGPVIVQIYIPYNHHRLRCPQRVLIPHVVVSSSLVPSILPSPPRASPFVFSPPPCVSACLICCRFSTRIHTNVNTSPHLFAQYCHISISQALFF